MGAPYIHPLQWGEPLGPTLFPGHTSMDAELSIAECFFNFCTVLVYVVTLTNRLLLLLEVSQMGLQRTSLAFQQPQTVVF